MKCGPPSDIVLAQPFSLSGKKGLEVAHYISWWIHMIGGLHLHRPHRLATNWATFVISSLNVYFMNLDNENPATKYALPVIDPAVFETAESFGVSKVEEYTWKQLMDSDACTRCGRCQDNCPAWLTEKPLSPKKMVNDIKANMDERMPILSWPEDPGDNLETTPS